MKTEKLLEKLMSVGIVSVEIGKAKNSYYAIPVSRDGKRSQERFSGPNLESALKEMWRLRRYRLKNFLQSSQQLN